MGAALYLPAFVILAIACVAQAQNDFLPLRSNPWVPLRTPQDIKNQANSGSQNPSEAVYIPAEPGDPVAAATPAGTDELGRRLLVVRFNENNPWVMRDALVAAGVSIVELINAYTALVFGRPSVVFGTVDQAGQKMAVYKSDFKVTPETAALVAEVAPLLGSRRSLLASGRNLDSDLDLDSLHAHEPAYSSAFDAVQTWETNSDDMPSSFSHERNGGEEMRRRSLGANRVPRNHTRSKRWEKLYGISARMVLGLQPSVLQVIMTEWPGKLAWSLGRSPDPADADPCMPIFVDEALYSTTSPELQIYVCKEDYPFAVDWLASMHVTTLIEPLLSAAPANAISGWIMQTGNLTSAQYTNPTGSLRPYWRANLWGQGMVVGVTDQGLDMSHCSFVDNNYRPGSLRSMFVGNPPRLYLPNHRKVVQYVTPETTGTRWFGGEDQSHGTHVVGTIAGAVLNSTGGISFDGATGSAPMARVSFFGTSAPSENKFRVPSPLDDKVLSYHYGVGARISSESWGRSSALGVAYLPTSRQFDAFAWRNPDFVSVIAAGNFGRNGMVSITAPGTSKNGITVGATHNYPQDTASAGLNYMFFIRYRDASGTRVDSALWPRMGTDQTVWRTLLANKEVPVRLPNPENACTALQGSYAGSVVIVDLKQGCTNNTMTSNIVKAGAAAILFVVADDGFIEGRKLWTPSTAVTYSLMSRVQGMNIINALRNSSNTNFVATYLDYPNVNLGIDSIAQFSGSGPLYDGRIKPDVVAPGTNLISACGSTLDPEATSSSCSRLTIQMSGTSMATPLVAGHLALVRQYFRDGFYPAGAATDVPTVPFDPSGMLLKAAAITSAKSLAGGLATNVGRVMGQAPDGLQGWGRLDLSSALPLVGFTNPNFRIAVADYGTIRDGEMIYLPGIRATGTGPIIATLVWHDFPGSGMTNRDLINDLDFGYLLNPQSTTTNYSRTRADSVNNVERVELYNLQPRDNVTFVVHGRAIRHSLLTTPDAQRPQRWSVLVAGHFTGTLRTPLNPAFARPARVPANMLIQMPNGTCLTVRANNLVFDPAATACNATTAIFNFIEEPASVPPPPPPSPSPPVPTPAVQDPPQLWYPFPLTFRVDFYPVTNVASANTYDYDYTDDTLRSTVSNFDLQVSWNWNGQTFSAGIGNFLGYETAISSSGAVHGGDNIIYGTMYEEIHWQLGYTPPPTTYYVCVAWQGPTASSNMNVILTVFKNDPVASISTTFNTDFDNFADGDCTPSSVGYIGSYDLNSPPSLPPPSPSPPPAPVNNIYPLMFKADWLVLSGVTGRTNALVDIDIIVAWTDKGILYELSFDFPDSTSGSGKYGGNNFITNVNSENAYLTATPPQTRYDVCLRWYDDKKPLAASATPTGCVPGPIAVSKQLIRTLFPYNVVRQPRYGIASSVVGTKSPIRGARAGVSYDWDMVVAWTANQQTYEVSTYDRNVGGGVHGGDNMMLAGKPNGEVRDYREGFGYFNDLHELYERVTADERVEPSTMRNGGAQFDASRNPAAAVEGEAASGGADTGVTVAANGSTAPRAAAGLQGINIPILVVAAVGVVILGAAMGSFVTIVLFGWTQARRSRGYSALST
ncbi:hypothetical protein VOLCADRAFT_106326 [Volvox carteri f. nagariensis]|uniref:Peptidase S8/S53 domain-containing protein n=1 Tax=Volvox carteri f. nagariensis TaxID=3068 RepID=D8U6L0_VOLCA|nr:uncharacterized protein VOLCADRAFT_106326 [Volvox carteri f. nagariensis]EFJ44665.1 hypothetical protein VOLCADRAFT_106326 [Volvox carteri f. nagariensis]|eukprot:XP_002954241.1 hypothetical protein VOLCADRAFT_106326 [Volvox carteri f. nagariensis]